MIDRSPFGKGGKPVFAQGFRLQRHSISQVIQANSYLETIWGVDDDGKAVQKRPYTTEEVRWIRNERAMCACDFLYWATRYAFVKDQTDTLVRFAPRLPQLVVLDDFSNMEADGVAILIQVLKARQLGVTTLSELIMLWKTMMFPGTTSLVASSRPDKTAEMVGKMDICYQNQPAWLVPRIVTNNSSVIGFDDQDSYINLNHGAVMSGMGRGSTVTTFHLSEVSEWLNPKKDIDAALLHAVHDSPWIIGILESTAMGRSGWWFDKWKYNIDHWSLGMSRLKPVFLPWYAGVDLYPTPTWLKGHPIPKDHRFADMTINHAGRAKGYVQSGVNKVLTQFLGSSWEMPPEQMWYWEVNRAESAANKELHVFYQEMCSDDIEAFQSPNASAFSADLIIEMREKTPMPYGVYGIQGSQAEIPPQFQPADMDIDRNRAPINIIAQWNPMQPKHEYRLVPLLHRGSTTFSPLGKVIMYEPPIAGESYGIGTDTGYGIGKDNTVLEGIRKGSPTRGVGQVFEFASPNMNSFEVWPINLALGTLYSTEVDGKRRQARQVIEGAANGENVFNELKKRGWREFHDWARYDRRIVQAVSNRQVWYTNTWSRPLMMDMLLSAINSGWLDISSPWFIEEMADLELDEVKLRLAASAGKHDDRLMAMGIVLFSLHVRETLHQDRWLSRKPMGQSDEPMRFAKYSEGEQGQAPGMDSHLLVPYTYRVVNPNSEEGEFLQNAGPTIWPGRV